MQASFELRRAHERASELLAEAARDRLARAAIRHPRFRFRARIARALFAFGHLIVNVGRRVEPTEAM